MSKTNRQWLSELAQVECPDSTFIDPENSIVFAKAAGSYIFDVEGKAYLDLCAGFGVLALGHNPPAFKQTLETYLRTDLPPIEHGMGDVFPSIAKIELLQEIKRHLPPYLSVGALALSGAGAVEIAMKTAILASGRQGFISFKGGYHGLDMAPLTLTERNFFKNRFAPWVQESLVAFCAFDSNEEQLRDDLRAALAEQKRAGCGTAAVIVEPVQGRAGVRVPRAGWLRALSEFCRQERVLLIFDEIFTGVGRTGTFCHAGADGVECDIICLGKALGGGLPIAACFARPQVMGAWPRSQGEAMHTGTFFGHPLTCAVANATLHSLAKEKLFMHSCEEGNWFKDELKKLARAFPQIKEVRGQGLMIGIEFREKNFAADLMNKLLKIGIIALPSGAFAQVLSFTPPLNIERKDLQKTLDAMQQVLAKKNQL